MHALHKLMRALLEDADAFPAALRTIIKEDLEVSVAEFAQVSGIPQPTIYKLLSGEHEPNLRTVRLCVRAIIALEGTNARGFIAVVAPPATLGRLNRDALAREHAVVIKEYPAATVEDALVAGVWAEREGALTIVTGPLEGSYLRRVTTLDVLTPEPDEALEAVVRRASASVRAMSGASRAAPGAGAVP
ncbi:MAG TPA: helix-turn-helix domain-containing protein [Candidatus Thermoplasmatota archaeon]